jgi:hypothetical protein
VNGVTTNERFVVQENNAAVVDYAAFTQGAAADGFVNFRSPSGYQSAISFQNNGGGDLFSLGKNLDNSFFLWDQARLRTVMTIYSDGAHFMPNHGAVGIGSTSISNGTILDIRGTGLNYSSMIVPRDTSPMRPTGVNGMIRYNTTSNKFEVYESTWQNMLPRTLMVSDQKSSGTVGGTCTAGSYATRNLNTISTNTIQGASVASDQITLPAGTYIIRAVSRACLNTNSNRTYKSRFRNVTDSNDVAIGSALSGKGDTSFPSCMDTTILGTFTISSSKTFELQMRCSASIGSNDFGAPASFGDAEVYSQVEIVQQ